MKTISIGVGDDTHKKLCDDGSCEESGQPLIEIQGLSVWYGKRQVLSDINFTAGLCRITALIGPSGSGKSTFLSCINRMTDLLPTCRVEGRIQVGDVLANDPKTDVLGLRRRVGMIFQKPNPFPLSIRKNLELPLRQHDVVEKKLIDAKIEACLTAVGLWNEVKDRMHDSALELSGGQQQRLCIARSLVLEPEVILFDEPCSALDPISSKVVEDLIREMRKNYTIVIVTHNLAQARRIADQVSVFWQVDGVGRLIEKGSTQEIFSAPAQSQTREYVYGLNG